MSDPVFLPGGRAGIGIIIYYIQSKELLKNFTKPKMK